MLGWVVRFMGVVNIGEFAGENAERGKLELRNGIR
jgi:hypothetical protein